MAKADGPGFMDKHIEKVILLVCLLVLLYALMQYGVSSKRTFEIGNEPVTPKQIDSVLLRKAQRLERLVEEKDPPPITPRNDMALLKTMQQDPIPTPSPSDKQEFGVQPVAKLALPFGAPAQPTLTAKDIIEPGQIPSLEKLIDVMPPPARPLCWAGPELMVHEVPGIDDKPEIKLEEPTTWRAVSWYSWNELIDAWQKLLLPTVIEPEIVALGYEAEIQVKQPDGTWKTTDDVKPVILPIYDTRTGDVVKPDAVPEYNGENGAAIVEWLKQYKQLWTEYQLQPDYHEVWIRNDEAPSWEAHFPFDVLKIYPEEEQDPTQRTTQKRRTSRSKGALINQLRSGAGKRKTTTPRGRQDYPEMPPEDMMMPPEGMFPPGAMPNAGRTVRGTRTTRRPVTPKTTEKKADEEEPVEEIPEIPDYQTQMEQGKVLLWFHANNIEINREYRCRFRLVFANPLLTYDKDLEEENRKDAYVTSIKTKWSEWSEPINVKRDVEFFLTGAFPRGNRVTVTVFSRWLDQQLMYPISNLTAGDRIRGSRKVKVLNPVTGEPMKDETGQDPVIEFDTGAVIVKLDFDRRIQTSTGTHEVEREDVEMIYLDPKGNLRSRSRYRDRHSEKYNELEALAKETSAALEPEHPKRAEKKAKDTRRKTLNPEFGDPGMAPNVGASPADTLFDSDSRSRDRPSRDSGRSKSRPKRSRPSRSRD